MQKIDIKANQLGLNDIMAGPSTLPNTDPKIFWPEAINEKFLDVAFNTRDEYGHHVECMAYLCGLQDPSGNIAGTHLVFPAQWGNSSRVEDLGIFGKDKQFYLTNDLPKRVSKPGYKFKVISWIHTHVRGTPAGFSSIDLHNHHGLDKYLSPGIIGAVYEITNNRNQYRLEPYILSEEGQIRITECQRTLGISNQQHQECFDTRFYRSIKDRISFTKNDITVIDGRNPQLSQPLHAEPSAMFAYHEEFPPLPKSGTPSTPRKRVSKPSHPKGDPPSTPSKQMRKLSLTEKDPPSTPSKRAAPKEVTPATPNKRVCKPSVPTGDMILTPSKEICKGCKKEFQTLTRHLARGYGMKHCAPLYDLDALKERASNTNREKSKRSMKEIYDQTPERKRQEDRQDKYEKHGEKQRKAQRATYQQHGEKVRQAKRATYQQKQKAKTAQDRYNDFKKSIKDTWSIACVCCPSQLKFHSVMEILGLHWAARCHDNVIHECMYSSVKIHCYRQNIFSDHFMINFPFVIF